MIADVGDQLKFSFLVENTGDTTINTIAVTDNFLTAAGISVSSVGTLAPGASSIVEAVYTLKASDFLATKVDNTAYAAGTDSYSRAVRSNDSSTSTPLIQRPELSIVKTAGVPSGNSVGSTITYTFLVTNTGNLDLTNVVVKDPFLTAANVTIPTIGALAVNASQTVTATYSLKGTDFLNGEVANTATAEGQDPNNNPVVSTPSTVTTPLTQNPNITLVKTASAASGNNVGDTITYTFTVENTGNLPLTNVIIDDILLAVENVTIPAVGNLAVGEIKAVNATYALTKANFIAGMVDNTATAEGDTPTAQTITSQPSTTSTPLVQTPALSLVKTAAPATGSNIGDTIPYSFLVENTGDLPLTNIVINDPLLAAAGVTIPTIPTLAVGASQTVTANYSLTAANFLTGRVDNVATATALDPSNNPIVSNPSSTVTPLNKLADLKLVKTAGAPTGARIGDTVSFTFAVTNEGNQPLNTVLINDPLLIAAGITVPPVGDLAVGETKTVTANYILTVDDFVLGEVANSAVAFAKDPDGTPYTSVPSDTLTPLQQLSSLSLIKSATAATGNRAGETITFRFVVENTGNLPLTNVVIDDPLLAAAGVTVPAIATLAVGETQIVSAIYTLTDTDFVNSSVDNIATARGTDSKNTPVASNPSDTTTPLQQIATLELVKTAGTPTGNKAGSTVTYNFAVTNTGNIPLTNVIINDDLLTAAGVTVAPISNLGVGATITVSAVYVLTQADFQLGKVVNIAQAQGQDLNNSPILSNSSTTETPLAQLGEIQLLKTAGTPTAQQAGATLDYTFRIENTGNVNLTNVIVRDPMLSAAGVVLTQIPLVTVGEVVTLTIPYTLTQADLDNGRVDNVATVLSRDPTERLVESDPSSTSTPLNGVNRLTLQKTAGEVQGNTAGATILYTFVVTNSGATTLKNIVIDDALLTNARVTLEPIGTLLPGESKTVTATYIVTQEDFDRGIVENIAQARGTDPKGSAVRSNPDETRTFIQQFPELFIKKRANAPVTDNIGDLVEYSFEVRNIGNVDMTNIVINDPMLAAAGITIPTVGDLAPGQSRTVIAIYTLIAPDFARGYVENIATASGKTPKDEIYESPPSEKIIYLTPRPILAVNKVLRAGPSPVTETGQVLTYSIEVKNVGNMNLAGVTVADILDGENQALGEPQGDEGDNTVLNVDEVWRYTVFYTVTQADMDRKDRLYNIATASSTTVGVNTPPPSEVEVPINTSLIEAKDDTYFTYTNQITGNNVLGNAFLNDTLKGVRVSEKLIVATVTTPATSSTGGPVPYLDEETGNVIAPLGTTIGIYEIQYQICEKYNANNCADAVITVTVEDARITALDDKYNIQTIPQGPLGNVLQNDTLNGAGAVINNVILYFESANHPAISLDEVTGLVTLAPDALPGEYILNYRFCDKSNITLCASAVVTTMLQGDEMIRLVKQALTPQVKIGDIVRYTLVGKNQSFSALENIDIVDTPPAGFTYVENSIRIGDRDGRATLANNSPIRVSGLSVNPGETISISYALRVGPGAALHGDYTNRARVNKNDMPISNTATATVVRVSDPMFEESRIWGNVFNDLDGNGWQAPASATQLFVKGGFEPSAYVPNSTYLDTGKGAKPVADASAPLLHGLSLGSLDAIQNISNAHHKRKIVISQLLTRAAFTDDFTLTTKEGTRVTLAADGSSERFISGDVQRKFNGQKIHVERHVFPATQGQIYVEYHITNLGIDERGIPGVRLGTVEGLLVTTDAHGRYHLEGIEIEHIGRGKNFVVKLDASTLPKNIRLTTPNPLVKRLTQGLPARFDFGVRFQDATNTQAMATEVDIDNALFVGDTHELAADSNKTLKPLSDLINTRKNVRITLSPDAMPAIFNHQTRNNKSMMLLRAQQLNLALSKLVDDDSTFTLSVVDAENTPWASINRSSINVLNTETLKADAEKREALVAYIKQQIQTNPKPIYLKVSDINSYESEKSGLALASKNDLAKARDVYNLLSSALNEEELSLLRIFSTPAQLARVGGVN